MPEPVRKLRKVHCILNSSVNLSSLGVLLHAREIGARLWRLVSIAAVTLPSSNFANHDQKDAVHSHACDQYDEKIFSPLNLRISL